MKIILSILGIVLACAPFVVRAHNAGASWERSVGNYTIDVGYDPVDIVAGQSVRFDFNLWGDTAKTKTVEFAEVWTRITQNKDTLLATGIHEQPFGPTTLLYTFVQPGDYVLEVSFRSTNGDEIAAATFPFSGSGGAPKVPLLFVLVVGILGVVLVYAASLFKR